MPGSQIRWYIELIKNDLAERKKRPARVKAWRYGMRHYQFEGRGNRSESVKRTGTEAEDEISPYAREGTRMMKMKDEAGVWIEPFLLAYEKRANVKEACVAAGINRSTFRRWYEAYPLFREAVDDARENALDLVEGALFDRALKRSDQAAFFLLRAHRPIYREALQMDAQVEHSHTVRIAEEMTDDELERIARSVIARSDERRLRGGGSERIVDAEAWTEHPGGVHLLHGPDVHSGAVPPVSDGDSGEGATGGIDAGDDLLSSAIGQEPNIQ